MRRFIIVMAMAIVLAIGAFASVAGAHGSSSTCKFGQRNRPGCVWPTTTTTDGMTCHDRGCGGFPH